MLPNVVVIGSGLSAVGAIKALLARGIRPIVIDIGLKLEDERAQKVAALAMKAPLEWTPQDRMNIGDNVSLNSGSSIPKKLVFGSDYFYGKSEKRAPVESSGNIPPFSYALGGLSAGWGAAVLPPQECDLVDWPVTAEELGVYFEKLLSELPYSAVEDGLSLNFPLMCYGKEALCPSRSEGWLLNRLKVAGVLEKDETVFGQARLLVEAGSGVHGCQYCGQCMSGCVYGAIYKAEKDMARWVEEGKIDYRSGYLVQKLLEEASGVVVTCLDADGVKHNWKFDRAFLAAGAVNSTKIVLDSLALYNKRVRLLSRGGFVVPMLSLRRIPLDWPDSNTQPGLFMELRGKGLKHWVHVQISTENEFLMQKLGVTSNARGIAGWVKRFIASHIILLLVNYHSDHAGNYELWLEPSVENEGVSKLRSVYHKSLPQLNVWSASWFRLSKIFLKIGCIPMFPLAKLNSGAYHVGGTLPMKKNPREVLETDLEGKVPGWTKIHVVDTSVLPSLPGTTIGLLAMANAYRIAEKVEILKENSDSTA